MSQVFRSAPSPCNPYYTYSSNTLTQILKPSFHRDNLTNYFYAITNGLEQPLQALVNTHPSNLPSHLVTPHQPSAPYLLWYVLHLVGFLLNSGAVPMHVLQNPSPNQYLT